MTPASSSADHARPTPSPSERTAERDPASRFVAALVVAIVSGAVIALQGKLNGALNVAGAGALISSWFSYAGTLATAVVVLAVMGQLGEAIRIVRTRGAWWWFGIGLCGVPLVLAFTIGIPIIGVALTTVCSVAGQTVSGLILDARGVGVADPIRLTLRRAIAGLGALAGLAVAVVSSPLPAGETFLSAVATGLFIFVGGFVLAGQQAGNGVVGHAAGGPLVPTMTSVAGGLIGISVLTAAAWPFGALDGVALPGLDRWWLYLGGPLGMIITVAAAYSVRHLGTFALTLAVVGGQLVMAIALDLVDGRGVGWPTILSIAILAGSVALTVSPARSAR